MTPGTSGTPDTPDPPRPWRYALIGLVSLAISLPLAWYAILLWSGDVPPPTDIGHPRGKGGLVFLFAVAVFLALGPIGAVIVAAVGLTVSFLCACAFVVEFLPRLKPPKSKRATPRSPPAGRSGSGSQP